MNCGCGGGTGQVGKTIIFHLTKAGADADPLVQQARAQAAATLAAQKSADAAPAPPAEKPASEGPSTALLVGGGVAAVLAIGGIALLATHKKGRR